MTNTVAGLAAAVSAVFGQSATGIRPVYRGGYTPALRFIATFDDGATVFVKWATEPGTAAQLRHEETAYQNLPPAPWHPVYYGTGTADDTSGTSQPFLVLEDLSRCRWPPPWTGNGVQAVMHTLADVAATRGVWVNSLTRIEERKPVPHFWQEVADNPAPFLCLGLCSVSWLEAVLPVLLASGSSPPLHGDDLLHNDVRSDNLCFRADGSVCLVDWNKACRGNALFDVAILLPSLHAEGGPRPEVVSPEASVFAPWIAGYFATRAPLQTDLRLRQMLDGMLPAALSWACRTLDLPSPW